VTAEVQESYDAMAEQYAALFVGDLDRDPNGRDWLAAFAELAATRDGAVADLGCGPGHVVNHLCELGLTAVGYDLSPNQIAEARSAFPDSQFHVGDLAALDNPTPHSEGSSPAIHSSTWLRRVSATSSRSGCGCSSREHRFSCRSLRDRRLVRMAHRSNTLW